MKTVFVENMENTQRVYDSLLLNPRHLGIFSSDLAIRVINELAKQPLCAMDISKRLKENEQKIYYHLRKMKVAGIVKLNGTEQRYGMTAKMFQLVSPVISTKLYDEGYEIKEDIKNISPVVSEFLKPFIMDGKLNAKIIIGDPYPHGEYDSGGMDGCYVADMALFLGNFLRELTMPCYKLDILTSPEDLKNNNLIIIGSPKGNVVSYNLCQHLPISFDKDLTITSKLSGTNYTDDLAGVVIKMDNPYNKKKKILFLAGRRTRGTQTAVIAVTRYLEEVVKGNSYNTDIIARVVHGVDKTGNGMIDTIKFLE
ncbi:MAG: ArsR family transcriptional regulator [Candidatus Aenigmarchaeota archaeon]|nr:ArsR family transcriptional regulator [Candidatus Aenigmarchaeota archaeon]